MNGNIQVEPIRVKLDKQGATSLKEEKTVDAIVRPQLTITQSLSLLDIKVCCVFATRKVFEKFRGWGSGPHLFYPVPVLPPSLSSIRKGAGHRVMGVYL
jgi:hypothetical protein